MSEQLKCLSNEDLANMVAQLMEKKDMSKTDIAKITGYSRPSISNFLTKKTCTENMRNTIINFLDLNEANVETDKMCAEMNAESAYKTELEIYPTIEFQKAIGFIADMKGRRKMGCIIGAPGCGKTTVVTEYAKRDPDAIVMEATMGMKTIDLLEEIAENLGITLNAGSLHKKMMQIIRDYDGRDVIFIMDESEYLKKFDVDKFEVLRKIWDKAKIPIVFVGTEKLKRYLIEGNSGKDNLSQLYRRIYKFEFTGIKGAEVREILRNFNVDKSATTILVDLATDYHFGGMGNFAEVLELCLQQTEGEKITYAVAENAKRYKMLFK